MTQKRGMFLHLHQCVSRRFSSSASRIIMATTATTSSPFTKAVVQSMQKLYPEKLADASFDNTGLLLEAPHRPHSRNSVLLTVDLTKAVADEAIAGQASVIIAYHPIIFRPLKGLTLANSQQASLLRLAQEGISVYCPHTAVDAAPGGLNDWLADIVTGKHAVQSYTSEIAFRPTWTEHERTVITAVTDVPGFENAGYGRIVRFRSPEPLCTLLVRIRRGLGNLDGLSVAIPQSVPQHEQSFLPIRSVGICAGSGGSMLNGIDVDLLFTGEMSHHEALAANEQQRVVVTAFHSNTERAFLKDRMKNLLQTQIAQDHPSIEDFGVILSSVDRDPFQLVTEDDPNWEIE